MKRPVSDVYCPQQTFQQLAAAAGVPSFPTAAVAAVPQYSLTQCLGAFSAHPAALAPPVLSHPLTSPPSAAHIAQMPPVMHFIDQVSYCN